MAISLIQLNKQIKDSIPKKKYILESEISGVSNRRGNTYFTFKEKDDKLFATIWKNNNKETIEDGDKIKCSGYVKYSPSYGLSFNVDQIISKSGLGDIYKDFLILKDKLAKEGLFSNKKKKINGLIKKVLIITSKEGAAIQDIYRNLLNHNSNIKVDVIDAPVQGINCPREISNSITKFNKYNNMIIILTRGGGDYQDLNGFNQEIIVRSIYSSNNIIISAIGHETDTVLSDLVSDYTLPTPSLVAQFLIDYNNEIIDNWENKVFELEENIVKNIRDQFDYLKDIENILLQEENKLDNWINNIEFDIINDIYNQEKILNEFLMYMDSLGEITLYNKNKIQFNNLEDIAQLFSDKSFYIKIKNKMFQISNFEVKDKTN